MSDDFVYTVCRSKRSDVLGAESSTHPWYVASADASGELVLFVFDEIGFRRGDEDKLHGMIRAAKKVSLLINSHGGSLWVTAALHRLLLEKEDATAHVSGFCCSAAVDLITACRHVTSDSDALFMLHGPKSAIKQRAKEMSVATLLDGIDSAYALSASMLGRRIKDPVQYLDERDHWFTAQQALGLGLVQEVRSPSAWTLICKQGDVELLACRTHLDFSVSWGAESHHFMNRARAEEFFREVTKEREACEKEERTTE